ncbi:MAG: malto-oligosyltrehalose trehalohydrolase [Proteobacteria bacterium]|nr:malto-oligosyltrehalose trehalohydrolase [Pseudomonadota bacterium]MBU1687098.1 malto-oligosyltrehalose trehalohydrolase [Pseudomonadota bacterium]
MPFGAEVKPEGGVLFQLWAPTAERVELCFEGDQESGPAISMSAAADCWYRHHLPEAGAGGRYQFRINGDIRVPDPASRCQVADVHGQSEVIDPAAFAWPDDDWTGRPWAETVLYELHVGAFTAEGTFRGVEKRLDYLVELGVTAIELMPVADFPGTRNWGYDGVLPFAPDRCYGRPEDLKRLVAAAHARGLMVFLDVVYNHFGPEGNYLHLYCAPFFTDRHTTPWGSAINYDGPQSRVVRDFFIHNALYWLEEYRLDGLRLDAVHAIRDDSRPDILTELAEAVRNGPGRERQVHLVLENDANQARYLERQEGRPRWYTAQWNDDIHHCFHILLTGEQEGYYADYRKELATALGRCLAEGFAYQGEQSAYRDGSKRGEPSAALPPTAFVSFLQNHDQIGNRAFGDRLTTLTDAKSLQAMTAVLLLSPSPPLFFMGDELGTRTPFPFFCDFSGDLQAAVTAGRRREFAGFAAFREPSARARIPDPQADGTYASAKMRWEEATSGSGLAWRNFYQRLLRLRLRFIVPRLGAMAGNDGRFYVLGERSLLVEWRLGDDSILRLLANGGEKTISSLPEIRGTVFYESEPGLEAGLRHGTLPGWSVAWFLEARE